MTNPVRSEPTEGDRAAPGPAASGRPTMTPRFFWLWVVCLLGLDYFSTLAYQPSISFEVAGPYAPIATAVVVLLTLGGALPVYAYLAARSPRGQGSLGVVEHLVHGWHGKTLLL